MVKLKQQSLLNIYCVIQLLAIIAHIATSDLRIYLFLCCFFIFNIALVIQLRKITTLNLVIVGFSFLLLMLSGLIGPVELNALFVSWIMAFNVFFLSILMLNRGMIKYIYILLLLANILFIYFSSLNDFNPEFGNELLENKSRNYVSGTLAIFTLYYLTLCRIFEEKISIILLVLLVVSSLLLYGRSGIAISFMILLFGLYYRLGRVLFSILSIVLLSSLGIILTFLLKETNFSEGLDTPRNSLFSEYVNAALNDAYSFFFGVDIAKCCSIIVSYGSNPHNSFLMGHSIYGIISTIIAFVMVVVIIASKRMDIILLLLFLLIRYSLDTMGIFGYYDICLFTLFYFSLLVIQKKGFKIVVDDRLY